AARADRASEALWPIEAALGDFQERFSTDSCPVFACMNLPSAGGGRWGAVPLATRRRRGYCPRNSPLQPPPPGGRQWPCRDVLFKKSPKQHHLSEAVLDLRPARAQQRHLLLPADQWRQAGTP